ncbi:MAG: PEP-CTERM sorting domain-containing protein [Planctomycetota bacterium]|jgi:hypothetical protein
MKKLLIVALVLGMTSTAGATLSLVPDDLLLSAGHTGTIQVVSDAPGGYGCWIGIEDISVAAYDGDPTFTALGNPNGDSIMPQYDAHWYGEIIVSSLDPGNPILAGAHIKINLMLVIPDDIGRIYLYASDGVTLLDSAVIYTPEPTTIALLGLGGLFLLRRRK